mgnify:CR=1 FL=1
MSKKVSVILSLFLACLTGVAQVKIGEWKDHLSYNSCSAVAKAGDVVYASNGNGIIKYTVSDGSTELISKINGLSDIGVTLLRYNPYNNTLLIIYNNANIDVLKDGVFTNFPDIKRKTITGKKNINEVTFKNNIAYLACGFGIVVFDTDKIETKDTYYIGPGGSYINVYQIAYTDSTFIAATTGGLYRANTSTLLNNFQNWTVVSGIPAGAYNGVVKYGNKLMANYSPWALNETPGKDTLYSYDGITGWKKDPIKQPYGYYIRKLIPNGNYFTTIDQGGFEVYDQTGTRIQYLNGYASLNMFYNYPGDVVVDFSKPEYWVADIAHGFIRSNGPFAFNSSQKISVNGTHSNYVNSIDIFDGKVLSSPTKIDETGTPHYSREGLNLYDESEWRYIKEHTDTVYDNTFAIIDRKDPNRYWVGSWFQGVCEYYNGQLVKVYNGVNATIPSLSAYAYWHRVAGLSMDEPGNLWIGGSDVQNFLSVRKTDGSFQNFNFSSITPFVGRILADKSGQVWITFPRSGGVVGMHNSVNYQTATGMAVYKNNGFAAPNSGNFKFLTLSEGQGKLPDPYVFAIAEDKDGKIWIGTTKGIAVFYNPENLFNGGDDAQQILITQDNHVQILLETEKVTAIAIDGANRKWIGTEAAGVFCFSADGQKEIYHFTQDNSPLFSNTVHDIAYNEVTGDVFIGTDQGMQSYRTDIIKGEEEFKNVHAYPNPVKPGYNGNVYVKGLMDQSVVKITDINGNLVWETRSQGGQIVWGLKNINGQKVAPGVYLASCALADGSTSALTKILVLN